VSYVPRVTYFREVGDEMMSTSYRVDCMTRIDDVIADLCSDLVPKITCQAWSPGLSSASGFERPASTLTTRFPAALGIGHACLRLS